MRDSLIILGFFAAGVAAGLGSWVPGVLGSSKAPIYALYALILLVAVVIGADPRLPDMARTARPRILLVPVFAAFGTLAGSALYCFLVGVPGLADALAIGSGFGYYSLSSVLIAQLSGKDSGVIALLSNMSRELFTLLFAPLLVRYFGRLAPVMSGGATAMDTTLAVIAKFSGREMSFVAVISGLVLTLAAPLLISMIYRFL
ncbi:MAG TPA: lysine exporter LysO family protein [Syntrophales bacterium]|jgi:uncharacterized membrane protein YbjE (DUF340 family)|nr:lysine exporter LysO family protein [Syntrophales bacterium]HOG08579.1 lysine exporter LysO family protein [Syntrophales bacterium]